MTDATEKALKRKYICLRYGCRQSLLACLIRMDGHEDPGCTPQGCAQGAGIAARFQDVDVRALRKRPRYEPRNYAHRGKKPQRSKPAVPRTQKVHTPSMRRDERQVDVDARGIKARRQDFGILQTDLARAIGKPVQYVRDIENGRRRCSVSALDAIAEALECPKERFLIGVAA